MNKVYVDVVAEFSKEGCLIPILFVWEDGRKYKIDKVLKIFNNRGEDGAVATFTFKEGGKCTVSSSDFGGEGKYLVKEKLSGEEFILIEGEAFACEMSDHEVRMYEFKKVN